jgi:hypothetical protein
MNDTPALPGLMALRRRDHIIERALKTAGFMVVVIAGFIWAAPSGAPPPGVDLSFEIAMAKWVPVGAAIIAILASIVLARRYFWVHKVLREGVAVRGILEDVDVYTREAKSSENTPAFQRATIRSYIAVVRYTWEGSAREARLRLPNSPFVHGLAKDRDVDLIVHPSAPRKPLIRAVYLGRP